MAIRRGRILLVLCIIALGISFWRMMVIERERREAADQFAQAQKKVGELQQESTQLNTQLVEARQTVEGQAGRISNLQEELGNVDKQLKETIAEMAALKREHEELAKSHSTLSEEFGVVNEEKKRLEFKLSSLSELKKAIRLAKKELWNQRWASWRQYLQVRLEADKELLASDNRGFLVRNGASTAKASSQLQVHVLEPQPQ